MIKAFLFKELNQKENTPNSQSMLEHLFLQENNVPCFVVGRNVNIVHGKTGTKIKWR